MERKLTKVVDETEITVSERPKNKFSGSSDKNADKSHSLSYRKLCSCGTDVADNLCSPGCPDTCGDGVLAIEETSILCGLAGLFL